MNLDLVGNRGADLGGDGFGRSSGDFEPDSDDSEYANCEEYPDEEFESCEEYSEEEFESCEPEPEIAPAQDKGDAAPTQPDESAPEPVWVIEENESAAATGCGPAWEDARENDSDSSMDLAVGAEAPPAPSDSGIASSLIVHAAPPPRTRLKSKSKPVPKAGESDSPPAANQGDLAPEPTVEPSPESLRQAEENASPGVPVPQTALEQAREDDTDSSMDLAVGAEDPPAPSCFDTEFSLIVHAPRSVAKSKPVPETEAQAGGPGALRTENQGDVAQDPIAEPSAESVPEAQENASSAEGQSGPAPEEPREEDSDMAMAVDAEPPPAPYVPDTEHSMVVHRGPPKSALAPSTAYADQGCIAEPPPAANPCKVRFVPSYVVRTLKHKKYETDYTELEWANADAGDEDSDEDSDQSDSDSASEWSSFGNDHRPDDPDGPNGSGGSSGSAGAREESANGNGSHAGQAQGRSYPAPSSGAAASAKQHANQPAQPGDSTIPVASLRAAYTPGSEDADAYFSGDTDSGDGTLHGDWFGHMPVAVLALGVAVTGYLLGSDLLGASNADCHFAWPSPDLLAGWMA